MHVGDGAGGLRLADAVAAGADGSADVRPVAVVERRVVEPGRRARHAALGFHRVIAIADRVVRREAAVLAHVPGKEARVDDADVHPTAGVAGGIGELRADRDHAVVAQELRCAPARRVAELARISRVGLDRRRRGELRQRRNACHHRPRQRHNQRRLHPLRGRHASLLPGRFSTDRGTAIGVLETISRGTAGDQPAGKTSRKRAPCGFAGSYVRLPP